MRIVTLVPYRPGYARQRWNWDQTRPQLEALGFELFTGEPNGPDWSRAQAVNNAAASAGDWDMALIADCDTIPEPASIRRAVAWLNDAGGAVRPHMERIMLNEAGSIVMAQDGADRLKRGPHFTRQHKGGGLLVVTRDAWNTVGGYDEGFLGWGYEDSDFNLRLLRHTRWDRLPGKAYHLWHPTDGNVPLQASRQKYRNLLREYKPDIMEWAADKGLFQPEKVL